VHGRFADPHHNANNVSLQQPDLSNLQSAKHSDVRGFHSGRDANSGGSTADDLSTLLTGLIATARFRRVSRAL
jgi:hypothetical protein